ncbi:MAG: DUF4190 domain-containing protein [Phycisphaerales bacterium]|nr:DUF4190 domain-containing protein [Phycisphaerales bacterium]
MTQNSQAQIAEQPPAARVSTLAVASVIAALLCVPPMGLVGAALGVAALPGIGRSKGTVGGRSLALAGIVAGFLTTLLWGSLLIGANKALGELDVYGRALRSIQQADYGSATPVLEVAPAAFSEEQMGAFGREVTAEWGTLEGFPRGLLAFARAYTRMGEDREQARRLAKARGLASVTAIPARFDRGDTVVVLAFGQTPATSGFPRLSNLGVRARDGSMIWLSDAAP